MRQPRLRVRVRQRRRGRRSWTLCRWACIRSRGRGRLIPVHCVGCSHHPRARQHFDTRCCEHRVFVCTGAFSPPKDSTTTPLVGSRNRLGPDRPGAAGGGRRGSGMCCTDPKSCGRGHARSRLRGPDLRCRRHVARPAAVVRKGWTPSSQPVSAAGRPRRIRHRPRAASPRPPSARTPAVPTPGVLRRLERLVRRPAPQGRDPGPHSSCRFLQVATGPLFDPNSP